MYHLVAPSLLHRDPGCVTTNQNDSRGCGPDDATTRGRGQTDEAVAAALANFNVATGLDAAAVVARPQDADGSRGRGRMDEAVVEDRANDTTGVAPRLAA